MMKRKTLVDAGHGLAKILYKVIRHYPTDRKLENAFISSKGQNNRLV